MNSAVPQFKPESEILLTKFRFIGRWLNVISVLRPETGVEQMVYKGTRAIPQERPTAKTSSRTAGVPTCRPTPCSCLRASPAATARVLDG